MCLCGEEDVHDAATGRHPRDCVKPGSEGKEGWEGCVQGHVAGQAGTD